jgi:hypothetical protein
MIAQKGKTLFRQIITSLRAVGITDLTHILTRTFQIAFTSTDLSHISGLLSLASELLPQYKQLFVPYCLARDYLESGKSPSFLNRQHPEMREAITLLVNDN